MTRSDSVGKPHGKSMVERDLLAIPQDFSRGSGHIASGVTRMAATLWATRWRDTSAEQDTAVLIIHPTSNFMGHYALQGLAERGFAAVGMATRYVNNDSNLIVENCLLDVAAVMNYLRNDLGYEKILLVGNSGGGSLAALYQNQAESPSITSTPAGDSIDLTEMNLIPADAVSLAMAHPGRARAFTDKLDPAIRDESDPWDRDPELDMFREENGPPYSADFVDRYRAGQRARNHRITAWVKDELGRLAHDPDGPDDLPFLVHGTDADIGYLDLTIDPNDRTEGSLLGDPRKSNFMPWGVGHYTGLRSWLSQWSLKDSRSDSIEALAGVTVPVQVVYGTADGITFTQDAKQVYEAIPHDRRELIAIEGADHYFQQRPDLRGDFCDHLARWARAIGDSGPEAE